LPYQENSIHSRSPRHKTNMVFGDIGNSPQAMFNDTLP
jgi:hypothetical protein